MHNGILLRVGIDAKSGRWNAPCRKDGRFVYVPIPDDESSDRGRVFDHDYSEFRPHVAHLGGEWPEFLDGNCHLDPDFANLTYGDGGNRGQRIRDFLSPGDFIVFWAGLRSIESREIICSIIGFYTVSRIVNAAEVGPADWHRNAHSRYEGDKGRRDIVVFANPANSGRLTKHLPIGAFRDGAQRVDRDLLTCWGDLQNGDGGKWPDGYIQLSGAPPVFRRPSRFVKWFRARRPRLVHANNV